jgi:hypothetical protein
LNLTVRFACAVTVACMSYNPLRAEEFAPAIFESTLSRNLRILYYFFRLPEGRADVLDTVAAIMPIGGPHSLNFHSVSNHTSRAPRACMYMGGHHRKAGDYHAGTFIRYRSSSAHHSDVGGRTNGQIWELQNSFRLQGDRASTADWRTNAESRGGIRDCYGGQSTPHQDRELPIYK